jgi:hypothetical protein
MGSGEKDRARTGFAVWYYRWSVSEFEMEIDSNLLGLRAMSEFSSSAAIAVRVLERLSNQDRRSLALALLRRSHAEAAQQLEDRATPSEADWLERWRELSRAERFAGGFHLEAHRPNAGALRAAVRRELDPILGERTPPSSGKGLGYRKALGSWSLETDLDMGGRSFQLAFSQLVSRHGAVVKSGIGPLESLGISNSTFDRISAGQEVCFAEHLGDFVRRFLSASVALLSDSRHL